ncbi:retrovirus-related pol polyprotein from transposon TNT 1-94 [Tanacetum coccineum]
MLTTQNQQTWGSNATDIPSSSSLVMTGCPDCTLVSGLQMFETHDKESLSAHKLLEKTKKTSHQPKLKTLTKRNPISFAYTDLCGLDAELVLRETARTPQLNGVVERRNRTLVEAARTMLIFSKAPLFLWAEAINTTCYTQNRSLIRLRYNKTPYELMQDKKPDLSFFHVFGSLCYPTNDHEAYQRTILGLGSNPVSQIPCLPPRRDDCDRLFQPMFDEYFNPSTIAVSLGQEAAAPRAKVLTDSLVSTSIDQDALLISIPSSQEHEQSLIISQGFEESPKTPTFHDDLLNESPNKDSNPQGSSSNMRQIHTPFEHLGRWTKDHPIANVIDDPSLFVSTRKQLETETM